MDAIKAFQNLQDFFIKGAADVQTIITVMFVISQ